MKGLVILFHAAAAIASGAEDHTQQVPPVDQVSQAAIQSAFQILRRDYIRRDDLTFDQINRAALLGLLERLNFGAELVKDGNAAKTPEVRLLAEQLCPRIGVVRPAVFAEQEVSAVREALQQFQRSGVTHVILDLRSPASPGEFEPAAALLELFLPRGSLLFKLKQLGAGEAQLMLSRRDPAWTGSLTVLIDCDCNNVAETVAAVLHKQHRALVVGTPTKGATVRYETVPLDNGWHLRFARAEVLLPDDSSVFRKGVKPDLVIRLDPDVKKQVFAQSTAKTFIFEQARPRFNEAALVAGKNPELDDYIRRSGGEVMTYDRSPLRDSVLQRAVDLLISTDQFQSSKLDWRKSTSAGAKTESAPPP